MAFTELAPKKSFVLGVDIGGTTVKLKLFEMNNGVLSEEPVWSLSPSPATAKGVGPHTAQIVDVIKAASDEAIKRGGVLSGVGVGSPGRFDANGVIKPATNTNLGAFPGEFDNINLKETYVAALTKAGEPLASLHVAVSNDGNGMLAGMLEAVQKNKARGLVDQHGKEFNQFSLPGKHVALFGIGTGIGHAIMDIDDKGNYKFVTDGHASKLRVKVDDADWPTVEKLASILNIPGGEPKIVMFPDHTVRAEDLFCAPTINTLAGIEDGIDKEGFATEKHVQTLNFSGKYMARLIEVIHSGQSQDVEPSNGWSAADKAEAQKTDVYMIGGSLGTSPFGKELVKCAAEKLGPLGDTIQLVRFSKDSVAERAAATTVLPQLSQSAVKAL